MNSESRPSRKLNGGKAMKTVKIIFISLILGVVQEAVVARAAEIKLTASDGTLYFALSVFTSGDYAIVGAKRSSSAYIFVRNGDSWTQQAKLVASDAQFPGFGSSVSISGDYAIVGADEDRPSGKYNAGSAYIFVRDGSSWIQQAKLAASDGTVGAQFGYSVSISGETAVIGAWTDDDSVGNDGSAYIFVREGTSWIEQAKLTPNDAAVAARFGSSVSISGDYAIVGAKGSSSAYIFVRSGGSWHQEAKLASNDTSVGERVGWSVSISGDYAIVGAPAGGGDGAPGWAHVFARDGMSWPEQAKLTASDGEEYDQFGISVSISGDITIVGAWRDDDAGYNSGSAYIFVRHGTSWSQQEKLIPSDGWVEDAFGYSVSVGGETAIVGAWRDDDAGNDSGSAYIYPASFPAVELSLLTGEISEGNVIMRWRTESEVGSLGFHIYRASRKNGPYERVTSELIQGMGSSSATQDYSFTDRNVERGSSYWYKLEDVASDSTGTMHGPVKVDVFTRLVEFDARAEINGITLQWTAEREIDNLGFFVYRAVEKGNVYERLTEELIQGTGTSMDLWEYVFTDRNVMSRTIYWYKLEDVAFDSTRTMHEPIWITVPSATPTTLRVPSQYAAIQAAIDHATDGDTVLVADGLYTGEGNKNIDFRGKAIVLRSENGAEVCIIDCEGCGRGFYFHSGETASSLVDGFTVTHGREELGGGICCKDSSSPTITNNIFMDNTGVYWGGGGIILLHILS